MDDYLAVHLFLFFTLMTSIGIAFRLLHDQGNDIRRFYNLDKDKNKKKKKRWYNFIKNF